MARNFARVKIDIWGDEDFRRLSPAAQALYFKLLTSPTLNLAGVVDWRPKRLAMLTCGQTADDVRAAAAELAAGLYVVVDDDSEELLIRSFIRNDSVLKAPNSSQAMVRAVAATSSSVIRGVVVHELRRLHAEDPALSGWQVARELLGYTAIDPAGLTPYSTSENPSENPSVTPSGSPSVNPSENPSDNPSVNPSGNPSDNPSVNPSGNPSDNPSVNPSGNPSAHQEPITLTNNLKPVSLNAPQNQRSATAPDAAVAAPPATASVGEEPQPYSPEFKRFWKNYPLRRDKRQAAKAFDRALARAPLDEIIAGAKRYRDDPHREQKFTRYAATWLEGDCWEDDPLPAPGGEQRTTGSLSGDWLALVEDVPADTPAGQVECAL